MLKYFIPFSQLMLLRSVLMFVPEIAYSLVWEGKVTLWYYQSKLHFHLWNPKVFSCSESLILKAFYITCYTSEFYWCLLYILYVFLQCVLHTFLKCLIYSVCYRQLICLYIYQNSVRFIYRPNSLNYFEMV